jgi:hypothetical protein
MLKILKQNHVDYLDPGRDPDPKPSEKSDPDPKQSFQIHNTA